MAYDQSTRNRLQRFVSEARSLLTEEFTRQLQQEYGLDPRTGEVADLAKLEHLDDARLETAKILRQILAHYLASDKASSAANEQTTLDRIAREQAFTVLNRLAALRMAEARGLLIESVGSGYQSKGFQLYARLAGTGLGETGDAYRTYLFSVFDELAEDLPVLFDRYLPQGLLFPREASLLPLLSLINDAEIAPLWGEDETIGWIYQYFNSTEERKKMRKDSAAPRNSRELAVRNQFFTPRYVVEFLTDNTLGRIWYEMTKGETRLGDQCRYLVRRPTEIFLAEGETAPETPEPGWPQRRRSCSSSPSTSRIARSRTRARSASSTPPAGPCTSASTPSTSSRPSTRKPGTDGMTCVRRLQRSLRVQGRVPQGRSPPHHRAQHPRHRHRPPRRPDRRALPLAARPEGLAGIGRQTRRPPPRPPLEHRLRRAHARQPGDAARTSSPPSTRPCSASW